MKRIIKDEPPIFWTDYVRKNRRVHYDQLQKNDEGRELRIKIREHLIEHQKYLCCYCCGQIDMDNSHNEHIKSRDHYPQLSMDYNNLLASCTCNTSCGMVKANNFDENNFVSPLSEKCESHFRYEEDGHIVGTTEAGEYTIDLLQLNSYALVSARKNLYIECSEMAKYCGIEYVEEEYINEKGGKLPRFVDMVKYFIDNGYFDAE